MLRHSFPPRHIGRKLWVAIALALTPLAGPQGSAAQAPAEIQTATAPTASHPAYLQRGDEVEGRYGTYQQRLERFFETFAAALEKEAPDLGVKLEPPKPVPYGYQILPKLIPDPPPPKAWPRIISASFSWSATERTIEQDGARLNELETRLNRTAQMVGEKRRREYENLVDEYKKLSASQKVIASQIQYNRLWQGEIARDPRGYGDLTALHDAVIERQTLLDALPAGDERVAAELQARAQKLSGRINAATQRLSVPDFVRVDHPSPHRWIVKVPLYTDIEDPAFTERFRAAVENVWRVRDGEEQFSVALDIRHVSSRQLYGDARAPAHGEHIELAHHIRRFPADGAVLTTGATTTHVLGRSIDVGPHDIAPNTLAHEFGHILGFFDGYFRGYRDRGPDGYEVLEVVIDPSDIMSAPGFGRVKRDHFQRLLDARK